MMLQRSRACRALFKLKGHISGAVRRHNIFRVNAASISSINDGDEAKILFEVNHQVGTGSLNPPICLSNYCGSCQTNQTLTHKRNTSFPGKISSWHWVTFCTVYWMAVIGLRRVQHFRSINFKLFAIYHRRMCASVLFTRHFSSLSCPALCSTDRLSSWSTASRANF